MDEPGSGETLCQELCNTYTITGSPDFAKLRRFFKAAVDQLLYDDMPLPDFSTPPASARSLIESMKDEIYQSSVSLDNSGVTGQGVSGRGVTGRHLIVTVHGLRT